MDLQKPYLKEECSKRICSSLKNIPIDHQRWSLSLKCFIQTSTQRAMCVSPSFTSRGMTSTAMRRLKSDGSPSTRSRPSASVSSPCLATPTTSHRPMWTQRKCGETILTNSKRKSHEQWEEVLKSYDGLFPLFAYSLKQVPGLAALRSSIEEDLKTRSFHLYYCTKTAHSQHSHTHPLSHTQLLQFDLMIWTHLVSNLQIFKSALWYFLKKSLISGKVLQI